jgi:hypothetical protein
MSGVLKAKVGGVWVPIVGSGMTAEVARWNSAWGQIATASMYNGISALTTTPVNVATLSAVPTVSGRRYRVSAGWRTLESIGSSNIHGFRIVCSGIPGEAGAGDHYVLAGDSNHYGGAPAVMWRFTGTGSPVTLNLTMQVITSGGTANLHSDTGSGCGFWIEDIGPSIYNAAPPPVNTPGPWTSLALTGGWVTAGAPRATPACRLTGDVVDLRCAVKNGTGATLATLPVGFRPAYTLDFIGRDAGGAMVFNVIGSTGEVNWYGTAGNNGLVALNCSYPITA